MKLILENWRQYLNESENSSHYGDLYLFENDTVTKTSFYDALNTLSESDDDVNTFLENWEKSVDYQLQNLNEQEFNPLFKLATQAWMIQDKFKEKAAEKIIAVSKKINDYSEKNPKTVKVAKVVVGGLLAAAAVYYIYKVVDKGGDASDVMELAQSLQPEDPDLAREVAECAQEFSPEKIAEFAQEQQGVVDKVADTLSAAGEPALDQMGQAADSVAQDMPEPLDWNEMFMDAAKEKQQVMQGDTSPITSAAETASAAQTAAEKGVEVLSQGDIQDFATLKKKMILGDFDESSLGDFKKILRKMLDNGTLDSPGDAREMIRLHKQRNPKGLFKVLQKIGLKKTYQEPDGLDYWNALFDLEIAEPAAKTVTKNIGDITDPKTGIRWVD
jgi:hypothetical protein